MRGFQHDTDILVRQVDIHLAVLRMSGRTVPDLTLAERLATSLREMIVSTTRSSAADRARVRAAVHYFVLRRERRDERLPARSLAADQRVVNEIAYALGRHDLVVQSTAA